MAATSAGLRPPVKSERIYRRRSRNTLTNFFNSTGGIPLALAALRPAGLTQVSGETATGTQQATFDAMNLFLGLMTDPFIAGRGGGIGGAGRDRPFAEEESASAYAAQTTNGAARDAFAIIPTKADVARNDVFDARWSVWGGRLWRRADHRWQRRARIEQRHSARVRVGRRRGLPDFAGDAGGICAGRRRHQFFRGQRFGSGRSDLFQAGAFVRHTEGAAYVTAALAYGWQDITTDRTRHHRRHRSAARQFNANAWSGRIEGGYRMSTPWLAASASRPMPPCRSPPSTCRPMPGAPSPASTPSRCLRRKERHRFAKRMRFSHRKLGDAEFDFDPARASRLGA